MCQAGIWWKSSLSIKWYIAGKGIIILIILKRFYVWDGRRLQTDKFSEKFQRGGGGVIFNPDIYIADFGNFKQGFWAWNW